MTSAPGDLLRGTLNAVLGRTGPGARGEAFAERVLRITHYRDGKRKGPVLTRGGQGAALRLWAGKRVQFVAADGKVGPALRACVRQLESCTVDPPPTRSLDSGMPGPLAQAAGRDAAGTHAASYLEGLETGLSRRLPGVAWSLALQITDRSTWVVSEDGDLHASQWRWSRLRVDACREGGAEAHWTGGAPDMDRLCRVHPLPVLARRMEDQLRGADASPSRRPVCTASTPVLFAAGAAGVVLHEMVHGLEADLLQSGWSRWMSDSHGVSPLLTLWDDPTRPGLHGSYRYDDEGCPADRQLLVRRGRIVGCLGDRLAAEARPDIRPGHGRRPSWQEPPMPRSGNLCLAAGDDQVEAVRGERGLLLVVRDLESGATDPRSGDLTLQVTEGEWLENGRFIAPVSRMVLVGNVVNLMRRVDRVCSDRAADAGAATCSREGAGVPIGFLTPSLRTRGLRVLEEGAAPPETGDRR
ncbi:MAG: TldD/PmbA family protein [Acidobacteriota bacterium]